MKDKEYLNDYLFHYNVYTNVWHCFTRDKKDDYFNKGESYLSADDIKDVLKELHKENVK